MYAWDLNLNTSLSHIFFGESIWNVYYILVIEQYHHLMSSCNKTHFKEGNILLIWYLTPGYQGLGMYAMGVNTLWTMSLPTLYPPSFLWKAETAFIVDQNRAAFDIKSKLFGCHWRRSGSLANGTHVLNKRLSKASDNTTGAIFALICTATCRYWWSLLLYSLPKPGL